MPRGLPIFTVPTYENVDPCMIEQWVVNLTNCSKTMPVILIKYAWADREKALKEIEEMEEWLTKQKQQVQITKFKQGMQVRVDKLENDIKMRKQSKCIKDIGDYDSGCIITFNKKFDYIYGANKVI
ncbi:hypothetical protein NDU88_005557 [Pleurodeles waltl]|uniref:Uncharacterized protein n=1 Tax=Pleurodeles waltl TaxID=8319 RepID=A0AAV7MZQ0_PLEWA|nr:hypothetical protein NDU88_005557 [Pleurodeles waltl]